MLFNIAIIIIILIIILVVLYQYKSIEKFDNLTTSGTSNSSNSLSNNSSNSSNNSSNSSNNSSNSLVIPVIPTDFISIISKNIPWGMYSADKYNLSNPSILTDTFNRIDKNILISGNVVKRISDSGHGFTKPITELLGTVDTSLDWVTNLTSSNYTICSITRYTNTSSNQGNILTTSSTIPDSNIWAHGHYLQKRGIVGYNNYLTDSNLSLSGNIDDWVVACAKTNGTTPNNVIINGVAIGSNVSLTSNTGISLSINNNRSVAKSDFAFSYILIWDKLLNDSDLNTISTSFINYLNNGIPLYDNRILSTIISNYNNNNKSCLANPSDPNSNIYYPVLQSDTSNNSSNTSNTSNNSSNLASNISNLISNDSNSTSQISQPTSVLLNSINDKLNNLMNIDLLMANTLITNNNIKAPSTKSVGSGALQDLLSKLTSLENKFNSGNIKVDNIINLDKNNQSIISPICLKSDKMPQPLAQSFISDFSNFNSLTTDDYAQSKVWCECNSNNTKTNDCVAYNACRANYMYNKDNTYNTISIIDKEIYNDCVNAFSTFPKYLDNK